MEADRLGSAFILWKFIFSVLAKMITFMAMNLNYIIAEIITSFSYVVTVHEYNILIVLSESLHLLLPKTLI